MIAITHTPADGAILEGTTRGDGTNQLLKPLTWRWSRQLAVWYLCPRRGTPHPAPPRSPTPPRNCAPPGTK